MGFFSRLVLDNDNQLSAVPFVNGFGGISNIKNGPTADFLFVLSIDYGCVYRTIPPTNWLVYYHLYRSFFRSILLCKSLVLYLPYIETVIALYILGIKGLNYFLDSAKEVFGFDI